jgi:hypothetical protein
MQATDPFDFADILQVLRARLRLRGGSRDAILSTIIRGNRWSWVFLWSEDGFRGARFLLFEGGSCAPAPAPAERPAVGAECVEVAVTVGEDRNERARGCGGGQERWRRGAVASRREEGSKRWREQRHSAPASGGGGLSLRVAGIPPARGRTVEGGFSVGPWRQKGTKRKETAFFLEPGSRFLSDNRAKMAFLMGL